MCGGRPVKGGSFPSNCSSVTPFMTSSTSLSLTSVFYSLQRMSTPETKHDRDEASETEIKWDEQYDDPHARIILVSADSVGFRVNAWTFSKKRYAAQVVVADGISVFIKNLLDIPLPPINRVGANPSRSSEYNCSYFRESRVLRPSNRLLADTCNLYGCIRAMRPLRSTSSLHHHVAEYSGPIADCGAYP